MAVQLEHSTRDSLGGPTRRLPLLREEVATEAGTELPEFRFYEPRAGHPDWASLRREAIALAQQLRPGLSAPASWSSDQLRRLRAYRTAAKNFAVNRRLVREGREDLRPLYFIWTLLRSCNFACTYCDDHQGRKYPDPDVDVGLLGAHPSFRDHAHAVASLGAPKATTGCHAPW